MTAGLKDIIEAVLEFVQVRRTEPLDPSSVSHATLMPERPAQHENNQPMERRQLGRWKRPLAWVRGA
jgi:hypothetical protein